MVRRLSLIPRMFWFLALGFAVYFVVFQAARESWLRRLRGPGAVPDECGKPGHEVARLLLSSQGGDSVEVARGRGSLFARFDPRRRRILLGKSIYESKSIAAVSLAAVAVAEMISPPEERGAMANRRFVTRLLHPVLGLLLTIGLAACVFRPFLWKAVFFGWLAGGVLLLLGHAFTLSVEYKLAERAFRLLADAGLVRPSERENFEAVGKGLPLRDVQGVGQAVFRILGALLPVRGW